MRLRILLAKVNPEAIAVPTRCVSPEWSGRKFRVRQEVKKALRDTVQHEVHVGCYECFWQDYYHSEFQGFAQVYIISPANDLTVDTYYSTLGWGTSWAQGGNYLGSALQQEDVYSGTNATGSALLQETKHTYVTDGSTCVNASATYPACETILQSTHTTQFDLTGSGNSSAPWQQHDYTYDDYSNGTLSTGNGHYHNMLSETISGSNLPSTIYPLVKKWSYTTNDQSTSSWTYYIVNMVTHSEVDDASGHIWGCQDTTYDEGASAGTATPAAGWATTVKAYTNCADATTALTTYTAYDVYGNTVASVDGVASAHSSWYTSSGCSLPTGTVALVSSFWGNTKYTACTTYDATHFFAVPVMTTNALGQATTAQFDPTQGDLPTSSTDPNGQTTSYSYSFDSSGNRTVQGISPLASGAYTSQSHTNSTCAFTSTLPCYEVDTNTALYSSAITRTFYDSAGRAIETRTPGPGAGHDTIVMTVSNDQAHTVWKSVPFQVNSGSGWIDPNGATDYNGTAPGGTVTFTDALGRTIAMQDPNYGSTQEPGIACSATLTGTYTSCANYALGTVSGDSKTYLTATGVDPNQHVTTAYTDALGRTVYSIQNSGLFGGTLTPVEQTQMQYNALDKPTSVIVTDLAPQSGQSITSVTTTTSYDDQGQVTMLNDPDRGTHTYTYDADGHLMSDVSGSRTLGSNYDLLGRVGCIQTAAPTANATGACSAGNPLVQNTYDITKIGTQGNTDFPIGHLTQSIATTYYPDSTSATVTEQFQLDQRGRTIGQQMQLALPTGWNVSIALPTDQVTQAYNDANQQTTTTASAGSATYTFRQVYDPTNGALQGLSNTTSTTLNLATLTYNEFAQLGSLTLLNGAASSPVALASEAFSYDGNLRPAGLSATWLPGSNNSGSILSQGRSYDNAGNVTSLNTAYASVPGQSTSGGAETQNFCYDEQNRLIWAGNGGTQPAPGSGTCGLGTLSTTLKGANYINPYTYTHLGQIWQGPLGGRGSTQQYLYCNTSAPHQLTGVYPSGTTCATTGSATATYSASYDAWGNVTSRSTNGITATLSYDALNRLVAYDAGSSGQEWYVYDASGNRVLKRSPSTVGKVLTVYAFGLQELTYTMAGSASGQTDFYSIAGHLIGSTDGSTLTSHLTDAQGSVLLSLTSSAIVVERAYGPYGTRRYTVGPIGIDKGYTGQFHDNVTGLDYYNARYYDSVVGRFLSADVKEGNGQGMDPYAYVGGNPETLSDPTGQDASDMVCYSCGRSGGGGVVQDERRYNHSSSPAPRPTTRHASSSHLSSQLKGSDTNGYLDLASEYAYIMALDIQAIRLLNGDDQKHDYAEGLWFITDGAGNPVSFFSSPQNVGLGLAISERHNSKDKGARDGDAEQKLLRSWEGSYSEIAAIAALKVLLLMGIDAQLHVVLFSQYRPCGPCENYFASFLDSAAQMITTAMNAWPRPSVPIGQRVMTLDVFTSVNQKYPDVFYPGTVENPEDVYDYYPGGVYRDS